MRCAIYFTPPPDDPLSIAAIRWLGRDAYSGERIESFETPGLTDADRAFLTAAARRYGFHATVKAPFSIAASENLTALERALNHFSARRETVLIPAMTIALLDDFFALVPTEPSESLAALAAEVVTAFDRFRAPLGETDFAKRGRAHLSDRQLGYLMRWGYPFVFDEFRFHMTLTGPVPSAERDHVRMVLGHYFGALATAPIEVSQLALFIEPEPYAPLRVHSVHRLARKLDRKSA